MILVVPHIPKCAGTFLRDMLIGQGSDYKVLWLDLNAQSFEDFFVHCKKEISHSSSLVIGGHFTLRLASAHMGSLLARPDCIILSPLRDPFERFCSHYEYHLRVPIKAMGNIDIMEYVNEETVSHFTFLVGIYRTRLGLASRNTFGHYLSTGPYADNDFRGALNSMINFKLFISCMDELPLLIDLAINSLQDYCSTCVKPLEQLRAVVPLYSNTKVNANPEATNYAEQYFDEFQLRHAMFDSDYRLVRLLKRVRLELNSSNSLRESLA